MSDPQSTFTAWASRAREIAVILNPKMRGLTVDAVTFPETVTYFQPELTCIVVTYIGREGLRRHVEVPFPYLTMTDAEILAEVADSQEAQRAMLRDDILDWEAKIQEANIRVNHAYSERAEMLSALNTTRAALKALDAACGKKPTRGKEK